MYYDYTGIILGKRDIRETDRLYSIYTREAGIITAVANGVRKSQSKLAGNLENFNYSHISIVRNKGIGKITGSIVENNFCNIKNDLELLAIAFSALDSFRKIIKEEERDERIFDLLLTYLEEMNQSESISSGQFLTQGFIFKLLSFSGYEMETDFCSLCGLKIKPEGNFFSPKHGGIVCGCAKNNLPEKISVNGDGIKIIRIFFGNRLELIKKVKVKDKDINQLRTISNSFLRWIS